ncbi:MAG: hypothetical protein MPJ08_01050 [Nitrosopumilus sp.]|nr:hypothetical protein [Nitrosopumilus sp.]
MTDPNMNDGFYNNADRLHRIFGSLIKDASELVDKEERGPDNGVYNSVAVFTYNLAVYDMLLRLLYPLSNTHQFLASKGNIKDSSIQENIVEYTDINLRTSFAAMCGFNFEKIMMEIAKRHDLNLRGPVKDRFKELAEYFEVYPDSVFALAEVFYRTRNTLHNGGMVDKDDTLKYNNHEFGFQINEPMRHASWSWLIFFASEFIRVFIDIADSEKFKKYQASGI